jgi:hypothetical protein
MRLNPSGRSIINYDGENSVYQYIGEAPVGSSTSSASWKIFRLEFTGTNSFIKKWAEGSNKTIKITICKRWVV